MLITLPLPPKELHGHNNGTWYSKAKHVANARTMAKLMCIDLLNRRLIQMIEGKAHIGYAFYLPDDRKRDAANLVQMCKPYVDGIVSAGIITDDCWQVLQIRFVECEIDRTDPRVVFRIEER